MLSDNLIRTFFNNLTLSKNLKPKKDVLAMILRCAIDKQQDHVISIEAVCSRWQELIDKYCLWKDVAGNVYLMKNFPPDFQDNFESLPKNKAVNRNGVI